MRNLLSLAGPQQGVHRYPNCVKHFGVLCKAFQWAINHLAYLSLSQNFVAPLTYWHDTNDKRYRRGSTFLSVINNENILNSNYINNLLQLDRIIFVKYADDKAIIPNSSTWFGFYGADRNEFPIEETSTYQRDRIGLKVLDESGKLFFLLSPGEHLELHESWFEENVIPFLKKPSKSRERVASIRIEI